MSALRSTSEIGAANIADDGETRARKSYSSPKADTEAAAAAVAAFVAAVETEAGIGPELAGVGVAPLGLSGSGVESRVCADAGRADVGRPPDNDQE